MTKTEFIMAYNIGHRDGKAGDYCPNEYDDMQMIDAEPCEDAISRGAFEQVCKERDIAIEQLHELGYEWGQKIEPCADAVSRQAALKLFATHDGKYLFEAIRDLPPVTPNQRAGHWIQAKRPFNFRFKCSECGRPALKNERNGNDVKSKYCPRCGARMESEATSGESYEGEFEAMEHNGRMDAVESDHD